MILIIASLTKASAILARCSLSMLRRRLRRIQERVRSTIQRCGRTAKPFCPGSGLTICSLQGPVRPKVFPKLLYNGRARIEQAIGKLKRFKRIALRCEKTARNFRAFVEIAAAFISIKSVHTA